TKDFSSDVVAMPKIDGLACVLHYDDDGHLVLAATRGDGEVGENVTANVKAIADVPKRVAAGPLEVRGEVYLSLARFDALKVQALKNVEEAPKNPRNAAAGALRQKDPEKTRAIGLSFLAYDLRGTSSSSHREKLAMLTGLGFAPIPQAVAPKHLVKVAVDTLAERRLQLPYETDGVVIMVDDVDEAERLGATSHHPRWAIAWKFQGEEGESTLRSVQWQVARTGTITPVAIVDPVELSGVTVTRATLHHRGFLDKLGLTIGARLAMVRRGGVIPHVERVLSPGTSPVLIPQHCPSCGAAVVVEGDFLLCSEPANCVAARVGRLIHWGKNVDIIGLGESVAEQLVESGLAKSPADLYTLTRSHLSSLERLGPVLAEKLLNEIDKTRSLDLDVLLRGLGIEGLGKTVARQLAEKFTSMARLRSASRHELASLKGFGDVSAAAIVEGLRTNGELIDLLLTHISVRGSAPSAAFGPLSGKSFVFTGALSLDRASAEAKVRSLGAQTPSSVTKTLTHLVVGSGRGAPSTKQKAAEKLLADGVDIAILDEVAFAAVVAAAEARAQVKIEAMPVEPPAPVARTDAGAPDPAPPPVTETLNNFVAHGSSSATQPISGISDTSLQKTDSLPEPATSLSETDPSKQKRLQLSLF
ncbi:MAG TPA: NAD-dependent DNA ligase LigA, partial [Myxococcota bacterium]